MADTTLPSYLVDGLVPATLADSWEKWLEITLCPDCHDAAHWNGT